MNEIVRGSAITLASVVGDDGARRRRQGDVGVLIAACRGRTPFQRLLRVALVADVGPQLVTFDPVDVKADHHAVVHLSAATADRERQTRDGFAIRASQARDGALADALTESGDDFNLLVAGKDVHGGPNPTRWGIGRRGEADLQSIYSIRSDTEGPNPEVEDTGSSRLQPRRAH
ncbi:MAG TPA: hypothetical protein VNR11_13620 [Xanthobacteraceae bacterium]|nr:hypothetical protein [Xanthobacteraceae bacterium]